MQAVAEKSQQVPMRASDNLAEAVCEKVVKQMRQVPILEITITDKDAESADTLVVIRKSRALLKFSNFRTANTMMLHRSDGYTRWFTLQAGNQQSTMTCHSPCSLVAT